MDEHDSASGTGRVAGSPDRPAAWLRSRRGFGPIYRQKPSAREIHPGRIWAPAVFFVLCLAGADARSAIFGLDERVPYGEAKNAERLGLLYATGSISCLDGTTGTGFIVDISDYVERDAGITIIATSARVLYDNVTGLSRGDCAFRPASAPGVYLKLDERLAGSPRAGHIDRQDWAFARLARSFGSLGFGRLKLESRSDLKVSARPLLWVAGFAREWDAVALATGCRPDSGISYSSLSRRRDEIGSMIIHSCDTMRAARGGPLAVRENGEFLVVGINAGSSREERDEELYGIPYDPQKNFFNYSRRIDRELEGKLVAFVSRFAHVRRPSAEIFERNQLIREVQENLNRLGYDAGKIDGLLGEKTRVAIRAFQLTLGITPTGLVSEELLLLLKARVRNEITGN